MHACGTRTFFAGAVLALDLLKMARVFTETDLECLHADGSASRGYGAGRPDCSDGSARPPLTLVDMSMDCAIRAAEPAAHEHTQGNARALRRRGRSCVLAGAAWSWILEYWLTGSAAAWPVLYEQGHMREAGVARTGGGDWRAARRRIGCGVGCQAATFPRIQSMAAAPSGGQELVSPAARTAGEARAGARNNLMAPVGRIHASGEKVLSVSPVPRHVPSCEEYILHWTGS